MVWVTFCRHTGQTRALFFAGQDASTQVEQSTWPQGMSAVSRDRSKQKGHSSALSPPALPPRGLRAGGALGLSPSFFFSLAAARSAAARGVAGGVLRELDERNRSVQKPAESTSICPS
jgi:hypothetical protein